MIVGRGFSRNFQVTARERRNSLSRLVGRGRQRRRAADRPVRGSLPSTCRHRGRMEYRRLARGPTNRQASWRDFGSRVDPRRWQDQRTEPFVSLFTGSRCRDSCQGWGSSPKWMVGGRGRDDVVPTPGRAGWSGRMSVFKYMTADTGLRYLRSWALRYSPPSILNDPFELKLQLDSSALDRLDSELLQTGYSISDALGMQPMSPRSVAPETRARQFHSAHDAMANWRGMLCLSRTRRHLLMWAHYTLGHRGVVLEYDETHPCFARQSASPENGKLINVRYSDERPLVTDLIRGDSVIDSYLTKALEWAYEQEVRLFWWLNQPDEEVTDTNGERICLLRVPATAVRAVVLGCNASDETEAEVRALLDKAPAARHVKLLRAELDPTLFALTYMELRR